MRFARLVTWLLIWGGSGMLSLLCFGAIYTTFVSRNYREQNESIYRNHRFVGMAGTEEIYLGEGSGRTTYGKDSLIVDKPLRDDVARIAFLGDSFVEARHVRDAEKFTEVIERSWNGKHPDHQIQSLNLGLYGLDSPEWAAFSEDVDRVFHPDLVVLFVTWPDFMPLAAYQREVEALKSHAPPASSLFKQFNASGAAPFVLQMRMQIRDHIRKNRLLNQWMQGGEDDGGPKGPGVDEAAVSQQLAAIKKIFGRRLVILFNSFPTNLGRSDRAPLDQMILRQVAKLEIPCVDLFPDFKAAFTGFQPPFGFNNSLLGQGHLNQHGHELAAGAVVRYLESSHDILKP